MSVATAQIPQTLPIDSWPVAVTQAIVGILFTTLLLRILFVAIGRRQPGTGRPPKYMAEMGLMTLLFFYAPTLSSPFVLRLFTDRDAPDEGPGMAISILATALIELFAVAGALLYGRVQFRASLADAGIVRPRVSGLLFGALAILAAAPAFIGASRFNGKLIEAFGWETHQALVQSLLEDTTLRTNPLVLVGIVLVVPLLEEILFRGLLQRSLRVALGPVAAIGAASLVFAIAHDFQSILPVLVVGIALGIVCEVTGSVFPSALAHSIFNGLQVTLILNQAS